MYTFAEPIRRGGHIQANGVPLREVFVYVKTNRKTYLCHLGIAFMALAANGNLAWNPTFFIRYHHWSASQAGQGIGIASAPAGPLGLFFGGWLADRLAAQAYGCLFSCSDDGDGRSHTRRRSYLLVSNSHLAIFLLAPANFLTAIPLGTSPAVLMQVTPSQMRGQASEVYLFTVNLIGLAAGPTVVALMTDHVFRNDAW
jgi:MFS family permease